MIYQGQAISVDVSDAIARLTFDLQGESINKFNSLTLRELGEAIAAIKGATGIRGLLVRSAKPVFIVGADITEFGDLFGSRSEQEIADIIYDTNVNLFNAVEDLPFPTVTAINGLALGGGLEMCMTTDFRVMADNTKIGFPEVSLGIIPGYGGTVRATRLIGGDNAVEWVSGGKQYKASDALAVGMVDAVVPADQVDEAALDLLQRAIDGQFDIEAVRAAKTGPVQLDDIELLMAYTTGKAVVAQQSPKGMIAPLTAVKTMEKHAKLNRDEALKIEAQQLAKLAVGEVSHNLINLFLGDQALMKKAKAIAGRRDPVKQAAVLGAGIMGGGIAYQSAFTGTPIIMKDIAQAGIDAGMAEAGKLLSKQVKRGKMTPESMAETLHQISPTLSYESIDGAEIIVEAVVENRDIKKSVLSDLESKVDENTVIASNTSTIPITELAQSLQRPENFCGMHFFNPVHRMPLVEIIRGEKTSEETISRTVSYALSLGKKPVVVSDCPGFLVNRILFAYFASFVELVKAGADFIAIDKAAEAFGWPMGPAYLSDVVGIDTAVHAASVMAGSFSDRMQQDYKTAMEVMLDNDRLGQKNGKGFYAYVPDKKGRDQKTVDESVPPLLAPFIDAPKAFDGEELTERLMVPFCLESIRCLEDGIAESATDLDMALIYGVGFPPFRGGAIRYVENMGLQKFCDMADKYVHLGPLYQPTDKLREMAKNARSYF